MTSLVDVMSESAMTTLTGTKRNQCRIVARRRLRDMFGWDLTMAKNYLKLGKEGLGRDKVADETCMPGGGPCKAQVCHH